MAYKDELLTTVCTLEVILQTLIRAIKILVEIIGWVVIAGGTTLAFGGVSFLVYSKWENEPVSLAILIIGFILVAIGATRISIKYGTMEWLSGIRKIS